MSAFGGYGMGRRYRVVVTAPIREEGIRLLQREAEVFVFSEPPRTEEELIEAVREADGLLVSLNVEPVTSKVIESAGKLRVIARHGIGYDNVDVQAATQRGIWVTIAPVSSETVADMAFAHLLCLARKVHPATQYIKSGKWVSRNPFLFMGFDVWGKTLGIIGLGRIGQAVARRAKGFGMRVIYYDKVRRENAERELGVEFHNLEYLLRESDFVTLHVPLTPETYHMIGERELRMMKPTAILVNTSRGAIIDTQALAKALREGWIAGAGLDVFEREPLPPDDPLLTLGDDVNLTMTPHIASNTVECRVRLAVTAAEEILRVLHGEAPRFPVNPEVADVLKARKMQ
ncbi:D-glycerate dehydrogenase [Infirmifilum sp. NZ]|nr:D-glycerate dehydrogenase [Infirmifilum sp. NZ]UNQ73191.1 D-glycerate dehydrogenase [Infirmifilum sp. NZ]